MNVDGFPPPAPLVRWDEVRTVLLDMDGTLLDLRFDNYFWLELIPQRFAARHGLADEAARKQLFAWFAAKQGSLDWYCMDYWTRELQLDIAGLKREVGAQVSFIPGAQRFLERLRESGLRVVLVTNAHADSLAVKHEQTGLIGLVDAVVTSHRYGMPKEHAAFWPRLEAEMGFDPRRALFVDDSLAVLRAARAHGIGQVVAVTRPDSTQPPRHIPDFPCVATVAELELPVTR
ncbi:MAG: GMP/IMP nucleotidase [Steroidobacteraceae bacterium]